MRTFDTPAPITVDVDLAVGDIRVTASDRRDTVVDVRPTDPGKKGDVNAAEQTRVEFADGTLTIKGPKGWRPRAPWGSRESIDVEIDLPTGSNLRGTAAVAALRTSGRLGDCHYKAAVGDVHVDEAGPVELVTGAGRLEVGTATGDAVLRTASGAVQVHRIDGRATVKNANGHTSIHEVSGELHVKGANGSVSVDRAEGDAVLKSANGDLRIGAVTRGTVDAQTAMGAVEVGIRDGVAAWLDLGTKFGKVHNELDDGGPPAVGEGSVEVRAQTSFGDITIRRAGPDDGRAPAH